MITYDKKSWKIHNERIFILSAAIHYFRLPRAEWDDVLEKAKAGDVIQLKPIFHGISMR